MFETNNKKISIIIACYNEEKSIVPMYERLIKVFERINYSFEIIYVDNDSKDSSPEVYEDLCNRDKRVKVILMSRNFGMPQPQPSFFAGLKYCSGDCAISLDGDIQDPPELIPQFIKKWEEGYDVVYGIRKKRQEPWHWQVLYKLFYRFLRKLAYFNIPVDASDFGFMDRKVIDELIKFGERDIVIRGIRPYIGFKQIGIEYKRDLRKSGKSKANFSNSIVFAKRLVVIFSYKPVEWVSKLALGVTILAFVATVAYLASYLIRQDAPSVSSTIILSILIFSAVQLFALAVIGEYLAKTLEEVKHRPRFIVKEILNDKSRKLTD